MPNVLIADSGSTKTEWCLLNGRNKKTLFTQGLSPYFLSEGEITSVIELELIPHLNLKSRRLNKSFFMVPVAAILPIFGCLPKPLAPFFQKYRWR